MDGLIEIHAKDSVSQVKPAHILKLETYQFPFFPPLDL